VGCFEQTGTGIHEHEQRKQRHKKPMGEVWIIPPLQDKMGKDRRIEPRQQDEEHAKLPPKRAYPHNGSAANRRHDLC